MTTLTQLLKNLNRRQSGSRLVTKRPVSRRARTFSAACEALEDRIALTIYSPVAAPTVVAKAGTTNTVIVGTFDSTDPLGGLTATVTWADGTTTIPTSFATITRIGSEFVPGVGTVPQYALQATFTATASTDGLQPQFRVTVEDSSDATTGSFFGSMQILPDAAAVVAHADHDVFSVPENSTGVVLSVLANDTGTGLSVTGVNGPANGLLTIAEGGTGVTYQPNANFSGIDSFSYTITDSGNHTSTATVLVGVTPAAVVGAVAKAQGDVFSVKQNSVSTSLSVLANDDGTGLSVTDVTAPAHGTLTINDDGTGVSYQPAFGFTGTDSFTYTVTDSTNHTSTATALVGVTPVALAPLVLAPASTTTLVNSSTAVHGIAVFDFSNNSPFELVSLSVEHGTLSLGSTAGLAFMPGSTPTDSTTITFAGSLDSINHALDTLTYKGALDTSVADTITIAVTGELAGGLGLGSPDTAHTSIAVLPKYRSADVLPDPFAPGKLSLVINGSDPLSATNDVITVIPGPVKNSYLVTQNGVAKPLFTGITGRILVFGQDGGNDIIGIGNGVTARTLLVGGDGNDLIVGGSGPDYISGGAGHNTLSGGNGVNTLLEATTEDMVLKSGSAKVNGSLISDTTVDTLAKTTFQNVQFTHLGTAGVSLDATGFAGNTVLVGGIGNDTLHGGSGYNVLIGGGGADVLIGGKKQDLIVAGRTIYDQNISALSGILAEWGSTTTDYAFKVAHIVGIKTGGINGTALLNASTVTLDGQATTLTGGADRDFFIKQGPEVITDRVTATSATYESVLVVA